MFGSGDSGGMFGSAGLFGQQAGGSASKEFGSSTATATIEGDNVGLQFDQKTLIILGVSLASLGLAAIGLVLLLRK